MRPLSDLKAYYAAKRVKIIHPILLIRINRLYRHGMSDQELYQATRGAWKLGERRKRARFALALFEGVVREVYEIASWRRARRPGQWEFTGRKAPQAVRSRYLGGDVTSYMRPGSRNPVTYVNA